MLDLYHPLYDRYYWNDIAHRYIDISTGRFVSNAQVLLELEKVIAACEIDIITITEAMRANTISLSEWQLLMEREIKAIHTASAALAVGGWEQMTQSDWGVVGSLVKKQYQWIDKFAHELANGTQPFNGTILTRAKLYAQSGRGTYEELNRIHAKIDGYTEERRLLSPAEHCGTCVEEAAKGWQLIGTLRRIGDSECKTNCVCRFEFR